MKTRLGIGLMSGTSGDGIDSALLSFSWSGKPTVIATGFLPYSKKLQTDIATASRPDGSAELICRLNREIGKLFGEAAVKLAEKSGRQISKIDFIGSHGQTIRHQPADKKGGLTSTLQIGEAEEIASVTGCITVSDFRQGDISAGGQGAPLAPIAHYQLFASANETRVIHNLGGISNVTILPEGCSEGDVAGFDTGPANSLLDLASLSFSKGKVAFDKGGKVALKGEVNKKMFDELMKHPFYKQKAPKSTGKEMFGEVYFKKIKAKLKKVSKADFLRTLAAVTAYSAAQSLKLIKGDDINWVVCGGGAFNGAVVAELANAIGRRGKVSLSSDLGVAEKSVESVMMAILGYRSLNGMPGNLPKVTGAKRSVVLGKITNLYRL